MAKKSIFFFAGKEEVFFDISEKKNSEWVLCTRGIGEVRQRKPPLRGGQGGRGGVFFILFPWNLECICTIEF